MEERFGPIAFVVKVANRVAAVALPERIVRAHGALTVGQVARAIEFPPGLPFKGEEQGACSSLRGSRRAPRAARTRLQDRAGLPAQDLEQFGVRPLPLEPLDHERRDQFTEARPAP